MQDRSVGFGRKASSSSQEPRGDERRIVAIPASVRLPAGDRIPVQIEDLSATGFRASVSLPMQRGMLLRVALPIGRSPTARIVWAEEDQIGCAFLARLDPQDLSTLIAD
jgi:hypothetical protein